MTLQNRDKLYLPVMLACIAGYLWIAFASQQDTTNHSGLQVCLIKRFTNLPCPSCGSTRAILSITNGNFIEALDTNPISFLLALIMMIVPIWILVDWIGKRESFFKFYKSAEKRLYKPYLSVPLLLLILINWIWNISKGL